jgi:hypothetical protein
VATASGDNPGGDGGAIALQMQSDADGRDSDEEKRVFDDKCAVIDCSESESSDNDTDDDVSISVSDTRAEEYRSQRFFPLCDDHEWEVYRGQLGLEKIAPEFQKCLVCFICDKVCDQSLLVIKIDCWQCQDNGFSSVKPKYRSDKNPWRPYKSRLEFLLVWLWHSTNWTRLQWTLMMTLLLSLRECGALQCARSSIKSYQSMRRLISKGFEMPKPKARSSVVPKLIGQEKEEHTMASEIRQVIDEERKEARRPPRRAPLDSATLRRTKYRNVTVRWRTVSVIVLIMLSLGIPGALSELSYLHSTPTKFADSVDGDDDEDQFDCLGDSQDHILEQINVPWVQQYEVFNDSVFVCVTDQTMVTPGRLYLDTLKGEYWWCRSIKWTYAEHILAQFEGTRVDKKQFTRNVADLRPFAVLKFHQMRPLGKLTSPRAVNSSQWEFGSKPVKFNYGTNKGRTKPIADLTSLPDYKDWRMITVDLDISRIVQKRTESGELCSLSRSERTFFRRRFKSVDGRPDPLRMGDVVLMLNAGYDGFAGTSFSHRNQSIFGFYWNIANHKRTAQPWKIFSVLKRNIPKHLLLQDWWDEVKILKNGVPMKVCHYDAKTGALIQYWARVFAYQNAVFCDKLELDDFQQHVRSSPENRVEGCFSRGGTSSCALLIPDDFQNLDGRFLFDPSSFFNDRLRFMKRTDVDFKTFRKVTQAMGWSRYESAHLLQCGSDMTRSPFNYFLGGVPDLAHGFSGILARCTANIRALYRTQTDRFWRIGTAYLQEWSRLNHGHKVIADPFGIYRMEKTDIRKQVCRAVFLLKAAERVYPDKIDVRLLRLILIMYSLSFSINSMKDCREYQEILRMTFVLFLKASRRVSKKKQNNFQTYNFSKVRVLLQLAYATFPLFRTSCIFGTLNIEGCHKAPKKMIGYHSNNHSNDHVEVLQKLYNDVRHEYLMKGGSCGIRGQFSMSKYARGLSHPTMADRPLFPIPNILGLHENRKSGLRVKIKYTIPIKDREDRPEIFGDDRCAQSLLASLNSTGFLGELSQEELGRPITDHLDFLSDDSLLRFREIRSGQISAYEFSGNFSFAGKFEQINFNVLCTDQNRIPFLCEAQFGLMVSCAETPLDFANEDTRRKTMILFYGPTVRLKTDERVRKDNSAASYLFNFYIDGTDDNITVKTRWVPASSVWCLVTKEHECKLWKPRARQRFSLREFEMNNDQILRDTCDDEDPELFCGMVSVKEESSKSRKRQSSMMSSTDAPDVDETNLDDDESSSGFDGNFDIQQDSDDDDLAMMTFQPMGPGVRRKWVCQRESYPVFSVLTPHCIYQPRLWTKIDQYQTFPNHSRIFHLTESDESSASSL